MDNFMDYSGDIETIILKFTRRNRLTKKEQKVLDEWRRRSPHHEKVLVHMKDPTWLRENLRAMNKISTARMWEKVLAGLARKGVIINI